MAVGPAEKLVLACTLLLITVFRVVNFETWTVPMGDYSQFRRQAIAFGNGTIDTSTPVGPITSALMAVLHPLMPGPDPYVHAGAVMSLIAGTLLILFLWRIAREFLPPALAILVVWLFAYNNEVTWTSLQPGSDSLFLCLLLLAFALDAQQSRWAYLAAALATLTRFQGGAAIIGLFVRDIIVSRERVKRALCAVGALGAFFAWYLFFKHLSGRAPYGGVGGFTSIYFGFPKALAAALLELLPRTFAEAAKTGDTLAQLYAAGLLLVLVVLGGMGLRAMWRRDLMQTLGFLGFAVVLTAAHLTTRPAPPRYALPLLWLVYLCVVVGVHAFITRSRAGTKGTVHSGRVLWISSACCIILGACWVLWPPQYAYSWWSVAFAVPLMMAVLLLRGKQRTSRSPLAKAGIASSLVAALLLGASTYDYTAYMINREQTHYAELAPVAEWCQSNIRPGERILCQAGVYSRLSSYPFSVPCVYLADFGTLSRVGEALNDVNYVLWVSSSQAPEGMSIDGHRERATSEYATSVIDPVKQDPSHWHELNRFSRRERTAIIYARAPAADE